LEIVLATKNPEKRRELEAILAELTPHISLVDADWAEVEETGETFEANALLKARSVHSATGLTALADDSGLEVDALGGEPGVRSARYAGRVGPDADAVNNALLLSRMRGIEDRHCRFVCVVAVVGDGFENTVRGEVEGTLRSEPAGTGGFGYDPLFEPAGWSKTFAEAGAKEKAGTSHRGRALRAAVEYLSRL
jgi:XTP/dITP diphosphohydrolase